MPYDGNKYVEPDVFFEHNGIKVYHSYESDNYKNKMEFWFTLGASLFNSRKLPNPKNHNIETDHGRKLVIMEALDEGILNWYIPKDLKEFKSKSKRKKI